MLIHASLPTMKMTTLARLLLETVNFHESAFVVASVVVSRLTMITSFLLRYLLVNLLGSLSDNYLSLLCVLCV